MQTSSAKDVRTVPVLGWVKSAVDAWTDGAKLKSGTLFRAISKTGKIQGCGFTAKVIWFIVREAAVNCGIRIIAPTISVEPALGSATRLEVNWSRFNSSSVMYRFRRLSVT